MIIEDNMYYDYLTNETLIGIPSTGLFVNAYTWNGVSGYIDTKSNFRKVIAIISLTSMYANSLPIHDRGAFISEQPQI